MTQEILIYKFTILRKLGLYKIDDVDIRNHDCSMSCASIRQKPSVCLTVHSALTTRLIDFEHWSGGNTMYSILHEDSLILTSHGWTDVGYTYLQN